MSRLFPLLLGFTLSAGTTGCTSPAIVDAGATGGDTSQRPAWPEPPAAERIRYLRQFGSPEDFAKHRNILQRLASRLSGQKAPNLVRPTGIAVVGSTVYVADPGAAGFWIVDQQRGRFKLIQDAGAEALISPVAVTLDGDQNIYIADSALHKVLQYDDSGTFLGALSLDETARPVGLAWSQTGRKLYIADVAAHKIVMTDQQGLLLRQFGGRGSDFGQFNFPTYLSLGGDNRLLVTDALNFRVQIFDTDGKFLSSFGHHGDGSGDFAAPKGLAMDSQQHIYVVDALFDAVQIFDRSGEFLLSFGAQGTAPGEFWLPGGIFITADDTIYVADTYNRRIQVFTTVNPRQESRAGLR